MKKKRSTKRIPDEIREQVKILAIEGHSDRYIAQRLNIGKSSVNNIKNEDDDFGQQRANQKAEIIKKLWGIVEKGLLELEKRGYEKLSPPQIMMMTAIAVDKAQLMSGGVTERLGFVNEQEIDSKLAELETAEKELQEAWERAEKNREKAAEVKVDVPKS